MLATRDTAGELRAFINVCRHRGAVLTEGCGTRTTIQCHYHAWTYDLDGSLRAAPRSEREAAFAGSPIFMTEMTLTVPPAVALRKLRSELESVCTELNCDLDLEPQD